jgi:hypothetical protein
MAFNEKWNTDDVLYRAVIIGMLNHLNRNVAYDQAVSADEVQEKTVPFFFSNSQQERFMQDFFMLYNQECGVAQYAEGNYDPVPRGIINISNISINSAALTSKFVRATFNKEENSTVKAYSAFLNPIPLRLMFDVEILCGTVLESFKIVQSVIDTFYKVATFAVDFKGLRVPCQVGFSEEYSVERPIQFTYGDKQDVTIKFTLEMETYQPVFDKTSERFRGNLMQNGIGNQIYSASGVSGYSGVQQFTKFDVQVDPSMTKNDTEDTGTGFEVQIDP